ncbi:MAG: LamG domain-containing protein, partial [Patescibacteria group bacterium]|nr:LamG domain-containing protein [Patescibacteria group bacterium]
MKFLASVSVLTLLNLVTFAYQVAADPVLVLHLNEERGTTAYNAATGGAGNGTLTNGAIRTTGVYGGAVQFDGVNDCIVVANSSHFFSANGFTIETWLRIDSDLNVDSNNNWRYLVNMPGSLNLIVEQARHVAFSITVDGAERRWWPGQTLTNLGQWYHTAWSYDPTTGTMRAYLNGVEATNTLSVTGPMTVTSSDLTISWPSGTANPNGSGSLPGAIDEFAYYSTVLSGADILARYTSGPPLPALAVPIPDTILFQFDEGAGRVAYDAISPRNNGSVNGGATWGAGVYGNAIHFDGANGHVRAPLPASQSPTTGLTVEGWFYLDQNPNVDSNNNWRWIFNKGGWASPFDCILEQDRGMNFSIKLDGDSEHYRFRPSGVQLPLGQWTHAAWTYDAATGQMVVYVNGTPYTRSLGTTGNLATND